MSAEHQHDGRWHDVVLCGGCGGTGSVAYLTNAHKSEYNEKKCVPCDGTGRRIKVTTIEFHPYGKAIAVKA